MYKELCLGIMHYMNILLTFKNLQNQKEMRHKDIIPIRLYGATFVCFILCIKFKDSKNGKSDKGAFR